MDFHLLASAGAAALQASSPQIPAPSHGGEANLVLPDLADPGVLFLGMTGHSLLLGGLVVCLLGLVFGLVIYRQLKDMPVHSSMREISELIYETCKTYLVTQGKFILLLEVFIGTIMVIYFGATAKSVPTSCAARPGRAVGAGSLLPLAALLLLRRRRRNS